MHKWFLSSSWQFHLSEMYPKVVKMNLEGYKNGPNLVQKLPARNATNLAVKRAVSWADRTADCRQGSADCSDYGDYSSEDEGIETVTARGMDELFEEDRLKVVRARKIERFLSHSFQVAEVFTNNPGKLVPIAETISGFKVRTIQ